MKKSAVGLIGIMLISGLLIEDRLTSHFQTPAIKSVPSGFHIIPQELRFALVLSDLDARDQFNRPIRAGFAHRALKSLFVGSAHALLMNAETVKLAKFREMLQRVWDISWGIFTRGANRVWQLVYEAIAPPAVKRIHPVFFMILSWFTLTITCHFVTRNISFHQISHQNISTVVLLI